MTNHGRSAPLQRAHVHCPITALAVLRLAPDGDGDGDSDGKLCILSGEDTHLRIRDAATGRLRASVHVFAAQPIQGIGTTLGADDHVLVWGGPWVAVIAQARIRRLLLEENSSSSSSSKSDSPPPSLALSRGEVLRAPDWIYHASLSTASPGSLAAVVTAHNEVIPLYITTATTTPRRSEEGETVEGEGGSLRWGRVRAPPSSRPILYSAQVRWVGEEHVLVAAGTAFGEIVVWRCRVAEGEGEDEGEDEVEVLHVLLGHEGSIFGVDISPEIQLPEDSRGRRKRTMTTARFLASCSDDRTIRVWDISEAALRDGSAAPAEGDGEERRRRHPEKEEEKKKSFPEARETGFGEDIPLGLDNLASHVSSRPLAMAMGHVSRIWGVRFAPPRPNAPAERLALYSFGEDATAQRWRLDLDGLDALTQCDGAKEECGDAPVASLAHEAVIHRHSGKHIWSSAVAGLWSGAGRILVVTGGSDGKVNVVEEAVGPQEGVRAVMLGISSSEVVSSFPASRPEPGSLDDGASVHDAAVTKPAKRKKASLGEERFLMYALLSDGTIIATTIAGRVFRGSLRGRDVSWTEMRLSKPHQDDLQQYQIVRSVGASTALLGSTSGNLYMCHGESVRQIYRAPGKIADICPLPLESLQGLATQQSDGGSSTTAVVVSTMGSSQVRLLELDAASENIIQRECVIELEKGFMITSAGCCQGYLIFGSRTGALLIYKPTTTPGGRGGYESIARIDRPSTKDAVSCIIPLPAKAGVPSPYFLTTSRDGRYRIYEITRGVTTDEIHTHLRHEALPPLGPVIESAFFFTPPPPSPSSVSSTAAPPPPSPELILAGFRGGSFVVWNETRQLELASVACGSGHRSFTCRVDPRRPDHLACVWTRAARTCVYAQWGLAQTPVKRGGHGREIKAVAVAAASGARGGAVTLLATGAEDTTVRIWRYHRRHGDADTDTDTDTDTGTRDDDPLRCLAVVERHTTGIQCLGWAAGGRYLVSSAGNEELFVWRTTRLERSDYEGLAVVCEGVYPDKTRDGDLRIMGFDVEVLAQGRAGEVGKEEEDEEEEVLCLSLVLSNSTLKTYRYARTAGFTLLAEGRYTGACLTQIRHLRVTDGAAEVHILTASTDGRIALWKTSSPAETTAEQQQHVLVDVARLHQSSIKALDLCALPRHPARHHHTSSSPDSYALLTGGDDDALGHTRLTWSDAPGGGFRLFAPPTSLTLARGAHAAAVTGLRVTSLEEVEGAGAGAGTGSDGGGYRVRLCTASNDQRVRTWRVEVGAGGAVRRVVLTGERYSGVADCGDLERLVDGRGGGCLPGVVVVGVGMEVWEGL